MNQRIRELKKQAWEYAMAVHDGHIVPPLDKEVWPIDKVLDEKFAELIIQECDRLNQEQSYELSGVIIDTEQGTGFDEVCLQTVRRVESYLARPSLEQHFGIDTYRNNVIAGAGQQEDDTTEYSIGTQEEYDKFVAKRNLSMPAPKLGSGVNYRPTPPDEE